jgi:imidazolonepropionase-like amidohydrolase
MIRIFASLTALMLGTLGLLTALSFPPILAQAPPASGYVALMGARVIDGTGGGPLEAGVILMNNGRIQAVGKSGSVTIPSSATRIDMTGRTIIPGLINSHAHLNVERESNLPVREDLIRRLRTYAMYGVTSAVSLGSTQADELEGLKLRDEQARGVLDRARIYTGGLNAEGKSPEEARKSVDRLAALKVDVIKYHINGTPNDMTPEVYGALVDEAKKKRLRTFAHVFYIKDAKGAVKNGTDVLAHSIRDQDVDAAFAAELKRKNIGYIPTLTRDLSVFVYESRPAFFDDPFFRRGIALYGDQVKQLSEPAIQQKIRRDGQAQSIKAALQQANRNLKILSGAGVAIAMGTDSGAAGNPGRWQGYFEHVEMEMMVQAGMNPMQVITAATGGAARVTKVDPQIGTIEPGKWADLLVLNRNPLDDIRNTRQIHSVWIAGRRLSGWD